MNSSPTATATTNSKREEEEKKAEEQHKRQQNQQQKDDDSDDYDEFSDVVVLGWLVAFKYTFSIIYFMDYIVLYYCIGKMGAPKKISKLS
jgi:hypothetical protein